MFVLERGKTAQQLVEVRIGDGRRITHVVTELVFTHLVGQFTPTTTDVGRNRISRTHRRRLSEDADSPLRRSVAIEVWERRPERGKLGHVVFDDVRVVRMQVEEVLVVGLGGKELSSGRHGGDDRRRE